MSKRQNGTSAAIRRLLAGADRTLSIAEVIRGIAKSYPASKPNNIGSILRAMHRTGELVRVGQSRRYEYALAEKPRKAPLKAVDASGCSAPVAAGCQLMATLGPNVSTLTPTGAAPAARDTAARDLLESEMDTEVAYTVGELETALGGAVPRKTLIELLSEGVQERRYQAYARPGGMTYALVGVGAPQSLETAVALASDAAAGAHAPQPDVRAVPQPAAELRPRLEAIGTDLEDALGDACDLGLDHALIKSLVTASGATQRALRQLTGA